MNESDLIAQALRGDDRAWEALVRQHQTSIFRLAYLLLGDADEAEDIAQQVFIRAFRALDQFDLARPIRPWLLRITTNLAHNRHRTIGRYLDAVQRWFQVAAVSEVTPIEDKSVQQWEARLLWQAVRRLKPLDQEIIYLRYFLELSILETSQALGISAGTVKSRLSRAAKRLRAVVEEEFPALQESREQ